MLYPQELVDQVISANNIVDVIGSYVRLTKKGSTYFGLCPFHNEKTPSFSVTDRGDKQMYYCFGCHSGGSVLTFVMKYENCTYSEALNMLAERAGITLPKPDYSKETAAKARRRSEILEINKEAAKYFYHMLKTDRGRKAYEYFRGRGLTDSTITGYALGYSDIYKDDLYKYMKNKGYSDEILKATGLFYFRETGAGDQFWNRAMFPIIDPRNNVVGFGGRVMGEAVNTGKYMNTPETEVFEKSRFLYGMNVAKKHKGGEYILCEGYMDVISLHQAGFTNAIATLGTAFNANHAAQLKKYTSRVIISYDGDSAGQDAALRAIPKLREAGISVKVLNMAPAKDPDEFIKQFGADAYKERLKNAENALIFELRILQKNYDLNDPDDRSRFQNEAASRISRFADEIDRENYVQSVSTVFNIDKDLLKERVKKLALSHEGITYRSEPTVFVKKDSKDNKALLQCEKILLSQLAKDFNVYEKVKDHIEGADFAEEPYHTTAVILFEQLSAGRVNIPAIINNFEEAEDQEKAADILMYETDQAWTPEIYAKTLDDCVINIKKNSYSAKLSEGNASYSRLLEIKRKQEELSKLRIFQEGR